MWRDSRRTIAIIYTVAIYVFYLATGKQATAQKWLFTRFYKLGGIYVKFLQLLAMQTDKLSPEFHGLKDALAVFDNVQRESINIDGLLRAELGNNSNRLQLASSIPFAAGSFGQVYDAILDQEHPVIIKVLRPSILSTLDTDLRMLTLVAKLVSFVTPKNMINFASVVKDFTKMTRVETNYLQEVKNAKYLRHSLENNSTIYVPITYDDLSTKHILVQEKIIGLSMTDLLANSANDKLSYVWNHYNTNLNYVLEKLALELIGGSLHGGTYGDPHPGNIFILSNNRLALIDFGIAVQEQQNKAGFIRLLNEYATLYNGAFEPASFAQAMLHYFAPDLTDSLYTVSTYFGKKDLVDKVLNDVAHTVNETIQSKSSDPIVNGLIKQYRMMYLLTQVINKKNRFGLSLHIDQPEFLRSAHIFLNLVHLLGCDKQLLGNAFRQVAEQNIDLLEIHDPAYDSESVDQSLYHIANWFERLQLSDPKLYSKLIRTWSTL